MANFALGLWKGHCIKRVHTDNMGRREIHGFELKACLYDGNTRWIKSWRNANAVLTTHIQSYNCQIMQYTRTISFMTSGNLYDAPYSFLVV